MAERVIQKSLAGRQDILFGHGQVSQTRAGGLYPINKVSMVWACETHAELLTLDTTQFTQATVSYKGAITHWGWTGSHWYCQETDMTLVGSFEAGFTYTAANQVGCTTSGIYSWGGNLPHVVTLGTDPSTIGSGYVPRTDVVLRDELASDTGYALVPSIETQRWIDQGDIRGWGGNIQAAIDANRIMRKTTRIPAGTTISSPLVIYDYTHISGEGVDLTTLKLADGVNAPLLKSDGADALWGTQSLGGVRGVIIENLTIDGNKASNSDGSGVAIYGFNPRLSNVKIINCGKNGLRTEWADSGNASGGMEGTFENISIDKSGEDGWRFAGPHDSVCNNVIIISSGQKSAGAYNGLWIERGNARWSGVHVWTNADDLRSKYALRIDRAAEGNEFSLSHFEGANTNVDIHANNTTIDETCKVYYPWNGNNIVLHGSNARIKCYIGEEYKSIGLPLAIGISFAGTYGGVSGSEIDVIANGLEAGSFYFGSSAGYNTVKARGYSASPSTIGFGGTPAATDMIDIVISGGNLSICKKDVSATRYPVALMSAVGTTQSDATQITKNVAYALVNSVSAGGGCKLPNATEVGDGYVVTVFNATATASKLYPASGGDILGAGVDNPLTIDPLKSCQFVVVNAADGKWASFKGA